MEHGSIVYCLYSVAREPTPTMAAQHRSELKGGKMTVETMIARQTRIERQETPHCASVSVDAHAANAFQAYVNGTLGFNQMRFGWMFGSVDESGAVMVHAVYEPEQEGSEDSFEVVEGTPEEASGGDRRAAPHDRQSAPCSTSRRPNRGVHHVRVRGAHDARGFRRSTGRRS